MSRFSTCGSWEGHYILDCLKENESNIRPDTIHADTQGQSTAIFGLAYLLGTQLMPRIRNWKDQKLFRPAADSRCEKINALFSGNIDWDLIEAMAPDMLRVAVSIQTGAMLPSDVLRRLLPDFLTHSKFNAILLCLQATAVGWSSEGRAATKLPDAPFRVTGSDMMADLTGVERELYRKGREAFSRTSSVQGIETAKVGPRKLLFAELSFHSPFQSAVVRLQSIVAATAKQTVT